MTRRFCSILAGMALIATLGACHQQQKTGHGTVSGEILPGSVSDAMLHYDTVKSKPPLAPEQPARQAGNAPSENAVDSADTTAAASADSAASPAAPPPPPPVTN